MLERWFADPIALGIAQVVLAAFLALAVVLVARTRQVHLAGETAVAFARGIVQVVLAGLVLLALFSGPLWTAAPVLAGMMVAGATISRKRARGLPAAFQVSLVAIALGTGTVIAAMTALGVIRPELTHVIPVGSMLVAAGMNANSLALNRLRSEVTDHAGIIEAGLALGASPAVVVAPYTRAAVGAALIPSIDAMRSLGIVWIPGIMAGMIIAGTHPVHAALYQFVVIAMIFCAAGLTTLTSTTLMRRHLFSRAEQLVLRPGPGDS